MDAEARYSIPETIRSTANKSLPAYSQIAKVELVEKPFEKTPKMSIKRYLYK
jgi:long-chain acyl-CoA synthetase